MSIVNNGIYPAVLTPYNKNGQVDVGALHALTEWYAEKGCRGAFAACLSSQIFGSATAEPMSLADRQRITTEMIKAAPADMDIVTSGHIHQPSPQGLYELQAMADTGAKALVLIANCLAQQEDDEDVLRRNLYAVMEAIPDMDLGLYECPVPYRRLLSPELLGEMAKTGRFVFVKETSCVPSVLRQKLEATKGTRMKIFNANSVSLLSSVKDGAAGLCGVMANFHPDLYVKLLELADTDPAAAQELQEELSVLSILSYEDYPISAKAYLRLEGLPFEAVGVRGCPEAVPSELTMMEMEHRYALTCRLREKWL